MGQGGYVSTMQKRVDREREVAKEDRGIGEKLLVGRFPSRVGSRRGETGWFVGVGF